MDNQLFEQMYQGQAPWDTGGPQPSIMDRQQNLWVKSGQFTGGTEVDF